MKRVSFWLLITLTVLVAHSPAHAAMWQFTNTNFDTGDYIVGTLEWDSSTPTILRYDFQTQYSVYSGVTADLPTSPDFALGFLDGDWNIPPSSNPPVGTVMSYSEAFRIIFDGPLSDDVSELQILGGYEWAIRGVWDGFSVGQLERREQIINSGGSLVRVAPVPLPETWGLLGIGLAMLGAVGHRRQGGPLARAALKGLQ